MPFYTVEKVGFCTMLNPRYQPPSKSQMTKVHILKLYDGTRKRVQDELKDIGLFSATTEYVVISMHDSLFGRYSISHRREVEFKKPLPRNTICSTGL